MYVSFRSIVLFLSNYKGNSYRISVLLEEDRTKARVEGANALVL
jgi:hypothetical protein